jgi:nucleoid-associated protein YgaU
MKRTDLKHSIKLVSQPFSLLAIGIGFFGILLIVSSLYIFSLSRNPGSGFNIFPTPEASDQPSPTEHPDDAKSEDNWLPVKYQVACGDSSWKLAEKFYGDGNLYPTIEKANNLRHDQWLSIGMELVIPKIDANKTEQKKDISDSKLKDNQQAKGDVNIQTHQVIKGESLWLISQKYYGSGHEWPKIYLKNPKVVGANPDLIYPGDELRIIPLEQFMDKSK